MQNITVERYEALPPEQNPKGLKTFADDWQGYIEPEDRSWILFIDIKGRPVFYPTRDKDGGVTSKPLYDKASFPDFQEE